MNRNDPLIEQIIQLKIQLRDLFLQHYSQYEVFGWVWWVGIAFIIIPLFIWLKFLDKKRLLEICVFGLIVNVSCCFLDVTGSEFVLWEYPIHLLPQIPLLFPVDFIILPVFFSLIYQKTKSWGTFLLGSAIAAAILAFGFEPFAVWIGQYRLVHWKYIYSFPIYIVIAVFSKWAVGMIKSKEAKSRAD